MSLDEFSEALARARTTGASVAQAPTRSRSQTLDVGRWLTEPAKGEVEELLRAWRAGGKIPAPLAHNPVPADAPEPVGRVADFFLAVRGLRHGELIDAPMMFSKRWVAKQPEMAGLSHATVGRAILKLQHEYGFFYKAGEKPASEKHLRPVFLYELCPVSAVAVERAAGVVREPDDPEVEVVDEPLMECAEVAGVHGGLRASAGGAGPVSGSEVSLQRLEMVHGHIVPQAAARRGTGQ